jgi:hypothetical protein
VMVSRSLSSGRPLRAGPVGSTHPTGYGLAMSSANRAADLFDPYPNLAHDPYSRL